MCAIKLLEVHSLSVGSSVTAHTLQLRMAVMFVVACCLNNKSVFKTGYICIKYKPSPAPRPMPCSSSVGLTRKASIWLFMAECRFRDAGRTTLTMLTTCTCACVSVPCLLRPICGFSCSLRCFISELGGEIFFNEVISTSCLCGTTETICVLQHTNTATHPEFKREKHQSMHCCQA